MAYFLTWRIRPMGMPSSSSTCGSCAAAARCCPTSTVTVPRGPGRRAARPQRRGQVDADAGGRGRAGRRRRARSPCSASRPARPALRHRVGYLTQAPSVYGDLSVRDNVGYFAPDHGCRAGCRGPRHRGRRPRRPRPRAGSRTSRAGSSRGSPSRCTLVGDPEAAGARRADRRARPGAAARPVGPVPPAGRRGSHAARLEPRHGRGVALRPAAAAARGRILADATLAELLARTGTDDAEQAFLALIDRGRRTAAPHERRGSHRSSPPAGSCASCAPTTAPSP